MRRFVIVCFYMDHNGRDATGWVIANGLTHVATAKPEVYELDLLGLSLLSRLRIQHERHVSTWGSGGHGLKHIMDVIIHVE